MFDVLSTTSKDMSWLETCNYSLIESTDEARRYLRDLQSLDTPIAFDIETTGLSPFIDKIVGFSFSHDEGEGAYFPLHHVHDPNLPLHEFIEDVRVLLTEGKIVCHNSSFDWGRVLKFWGIDLNIYACTLTRCWILDSERGPKSNRRKLGLAYLAKEHFGYDTLELTDVTTTKTKNFAYAKTDDAVWYAVPDVDLCLRLNKIFEKQIDDLDLWEIDRIERDVIKPSADMFLNGIPVDKERLLDMDLAAEIEAIEDEIHKLAGQALNPGSPDQVARFLYDHLKLPEAKGRSTDDDTLKRFSNSHPVIPVIREHREMTKLNNAFVMKISEALAEDGRLHCEFIPSGTRAGRYSSAGGIGRGGEKIKINGQQTPKGRRINIRSAYRPGPGKYWVSVDYTQMEYFTMAYRSQEPPLLDAIARGDDFHRATAAMFFNIPIDKVTDKDRKKGKTTNFGVLFGMAANSLANMLGTSKDEAQGLINLYFERLPNVARYIKEQKDFCAREGFVRTRFGRIRWFRDIAKIEGHLKKVLLGQALNTTIQGSAADVNKIAIAKVYRMLQKYYTKDQVKLVSSVHDEMNFEVDESVPVNEVLRRIHDAMYVKPGLFKGWGHYPVEIEIGPSYGELSVVPADLIDSFESYHALLDAIKTREAKNKEKKKEAAAEVDLTTHDPGFYMHPAMQAPKVLRELPAVVLSLKTGKTFSRAVEGLAKLTERSYGRYNLYIEVEDGMEFFVGNFKVNPTKKFIGEAARAGFDTELHAPEEQEFDINQLSF